MAIQTTVIPLSFPPEQVQALRHEQNLLSEALERRGRLEPEHLARLRARLGEALDGQPAAAPGWLEQLREDARVRPHRIHLSVTEHKDELLGLPWHLVAEGSPNLLVSKGLPLRSSTDLPTYEPDLPLPLKILVMVAAPEHSGAGRLGYEAEEKIILDALVPLMRTGQVEVDFTDDGSLESLQRALADSRYHVLHVSGHSTYGARNPGEAPEATLLLEDEFSMRASPTNAADFAAVLAIDEERLPGLVLLSSCQSGQGSATGGFRGVAHRLMQAGVPAVIAMGWSVADFWATHFAGAFFEALAKREPLGRAYNLALDSGRKATAPGIPPVFFASQSLVPQLFLTRQVEKIVRWQAAPGKRLSRAGDNLLKGNDHLAAKLKKVHAVFGRADKSLLFIGRRRERKAALAALRDGRSVLLRGQGGLGKTALALHLATRRLAADPDGCVPLAFDQTTFSLENLCNALLDYLEVDAKQRTVRTQAATYDKLWEKFLFLLEAFEKQGVAPFFIVDNLESFQPDDDPGGPLGPATLEVLEYLLTRLGYPILCTGRYPLREFGSEVLHVVDLNEAPAGDFRQKCLHLPELKKMEVPGRSFDDIAAILHGSLGGNYRALEFFDELCCQAPAAAPDTLEALDQLLAERTGESLHHLASDLVFDRLLGLLTSTEGQALRLLAEFRRPVLPFAVEWQDQTLEPAEPLLARLADLTLAERRSGEAEGRVYFFVPPLVRELLRTDWGSFKNFPNLAHTALDDTQAGGYYEKVDKDLNTQNYADLEEAFFHYERAGKVDKVNAIGDTLSNFYYLASQFRRSFEFARRTEALAGAQTNGQVLNLLGLLFKLSGQLDLALLFYEKSLADYQSRSDRQGEGVTLNNMSHIYYEKGDYDTALKYMQQSLKIQQETGNYKGEAVSLNSISQIYKIRGNFDIALDYLQKSLKIRQEIGDKGKSSTVNNIGQIYFAKGDLDTALHYFHQSLKNSQEIGIRKDEATALNNIGKVYCTKGDYHTSLGYLQQSLKITQEIGDRQGESSTLSNIGQVYDAKGDQKTALGYFQQNLKVTQEIGIRKDEAAALNNIGKIYCTKGDYHISLEYLQHSLKVTQEIGDRQGESAALNNISQVYDAKGDQKTALCYLQKSLKIKEEIGDRKGEGVTLNNIGQIYFAKGDYDTAWRYLQQSLKIHQKIGYRHGEGVVLNCISQIHQVRGDYESALVYLQQSLKIQQEIGDISGMATTLTNMGAMLFQQNDPETAVPSLLQAYRIFQKIGSPNARVPESYLHAIIEKIGQARFEALVQAIDG